VPVVPRPTSAAGQARRKFVTTPLLEVTATGFLFLVTRGPTRWLRNDAHRRRVNIPQLQPEPSPNGRTRLLTSGVRMSSQTVRLVAGVPGSLVGGVVVDRSKGSSLPATEEPSATVQSLRDPKSPSGELQRVLEALDAFSPVTLVACLFVAGMGAAGLVRSLIPRAPVGFVGPPTTHSPLRTMQKQVVKDTRDDRWPSK